MYTNLKYHFGRGAELKLSVWEYSDPPYNSIKYLPVWKHIKAYQAKEAEI